MSGKSTSDDALPISVFERIFRSYNATGFLPILLTVLLVAFALFIPNFVAVQNLLNVLRSSSYLVIIAAGQMLVLIVGGFDLSQGAVVALTSVSSALVMVAFKDTFAGDPGLIILVGVLAGLGCGAIVGLVNGACVAFLRISPFMVTLGTMSIATGFALLLTSGIPVYGMPKSYVEGFGRGLWLDLPTAFYLAAAVRPLRQYSIRAAWIGQANSTWGNHSETRRRALCFTNSQTIVLSSPGLPLSTWQQIFGVGAGPADEQPFCVAQLHMPRNRLVVVGY